MKQTTTNASNTPLDIDIDMDEVECIIANLIYSGKIKGYISHQKSILVLSKQDPFPITSIITKPNNSNTNVFSFNSK